MQTRPDWVVATEYRHERGDGAAAFRQLWLANESKLDGLLVLDEILYRDLAPMLLLNQIRVPADLIAVSHISRDDSRPLLPAPIGLAPVRTRPRITLT